MRVSELFQIRHWSAGVIGVILSGQLASGVQAQSVAQITGAGQQKPGSSAQVDSFLRDAQTALSAGDTGKAAQFLKVAEALSRQPGSQSDETMRQIAALKQSLSPGQSPDGGAGAPASAPNPALGQLLAARRAIASGDVAMAQSMVAQARAGKTDWTGMADSPEAVDLLISRQTALVKLAGEGKPAEFNAQAATFLMEQARELVKLGDGQTARSLIAQAQKFPVDLNAQGFKPDEMLAQADQMIAAASKPAVPVAAPNATAGESPVVAARRLTSMAMLAIDKRDWDQARSMVDAAMALNVADSEFTAGETRPWQLDLRIRQAQSSVAQASQPASVNMQLPDNGVQQAGYDPSADPTMNMKVGMEAPQNVNAAEEISPEAGAVDASELLFREMQREVFKERADTERMMANEPRMALDRMVALRNKISSSELTPENRNPLLTIVDRDIREMQRYIDENLPDIVNSETNSQRLEDLDISRARRYEIEQQMQKLVEDFNKLMDQQRYAEAHAIARQAVELDPDSEIAILLDEKAKLAINLAEMQAMKDAREQGFYEGMRNAEDSATPFDDSVPLQYPDADLWNRTSEGRIARAEMRNYSSEAERQIWNLLKNSRIQGEFRGTLAETIAQIGAQAGVNIVFDSMALQAENVSTEKMVDIPITTPISLQSALNVVLRNANLVFVVENEVIMITSEAAQRENLTTQHYYVGDLVFPVGIKHAPAQMNFITPSMGMSTQHTILGANQAPATFGNGGNPVNPLALAQQMPGMGNPLAGAAMGALNDYRNNGGPQTGVPIYTTQGASQLGGITIQDFQPLINLIQQTIANDSWSQVGNGDGTILPFVPNLSLVVSNTQEVQDQIQDLLTRLRALNDVQIVVEVRFIILRDTFFEKVGVDFDFRLNDNSGLTAAQAAAIDRPPRSVVVGNNGIGDAFIPTNDLDIAFDQNSFASALPQFPSTFDVNSAANFGFAILSDIEVFFLLQATKGDQRSNVSQAPTVTMFNGQSASVTDGASRPFVTSVIPVVGDFAVAQQPVVSLLPEGTTLNVQAVASNDRRHVTLSLNPFFSQVTEVTEFTFDGTRRVRRSPDNLLTNLANLLDNDPNNDDDEELELEVENQGVTIQLPVQSFTQVSTVVQVPDGGTVLMGGIKRMSEGRTERGVPFLSNIPYVNRLFKNVGIGRETSNLMMMVTPRIIIQEEEEQFQVGNVGGN